MKKLWKLCKPVFASGKKGFWVIILTFFSQFELIHISQFIFSESIYIILFREFRISRYTQFLLIVSYTQLWVNICYHNIYLESSWFMVSVEACFLIKRVTAIYYLTIPFLTILIHNLFYGSIIYFHSFFSNSRNVFNFIYFWLQMLTWGIYSMYIKYFVNFPQQVLTNINKTIYITYDQISHSQNLRHTDKHSDWTHNK